MEWAKSLELKSGTGGDRVISLFHSSLVVFLLSVICQWGLRVAWRELVHLAGLPRGGGDMRVLSDSNPNQYSMVKQHQQRATVYVAYIPEFEV